MGKAFVVFTGVMVLGAGLGRRHQVRPRSRGRGDPAVARLRRRLVSGPSSHPALLAGHRPARAGPLLAAGVRGRPPALGLHDQRHRDHGDAAQTGACAACAASATRSTCRSSGPSGRGQLTIHAAEAPGQGWSPTKLEARIEGRGRRWICWAAHRRPDRLPMPRPGASRQNRKRHGNRTATPRWIGARARWPRGRAREPAAAGRHRGRAGAARRRPGRAHPAERSPAGPDRRRGRDGRADGDCRRPVPPASLPPLRPGQVIESVGAARRGAARRGHPAHRRAQRRHRDREPARGASAHESGSARRQPRPARAAAPPRGRPRPGPKAPGGVTIAAPDAGAAAQTTADAGSSATAAADPGGAPAGISLDLADHADDDLDDVPLGDETRLRAHASSYAGFINGVRDRVRRVWRVREVYQERRSRPPLPGRRARHRGGGAGGRRRQVRRRVGAAGLGPGAGRRGGDRGPAPGGTVSPPAGIADPDGGLSFQFSFTFDLSPLRFLTATRQTLLERWRPSRAFRQVGDRRARDGGARAARARRHGRADQPRRLGGDRLPGRRRARRRASPAIACPRPPRASGRLVDGMIPLWVEFQHRVGAPGDVRVLRRYQPAERTTERR